MGAGITVSINDGEFEKTISRLVAVVPLANTALETLVDEELVEGKLIAEKHIETEVYARPQGPNTHYTRTRRLANSVRTSKVRSKGAVSSGQVYLTRSVFPRAYYPVYVEHGFEAGAPYEGRYFWAATIAELQVGIHFKAEIAGRSIVKKLK